MMLAPLASAYRWTGDTDYLEVARSALPDDSVDVHHLKGLPSALDLLAEESARRDRVAVALETREPHFRVDAQRACFRVHTETQQVQIDLTRGGRIVGWRVGGKVLVPDEAEYDVRAGLCCDLLDGRRFAGGGRLLCTTRTRVYALEDVHEAPDSRDVRLRFTGGVPGLGEVSISRTYRVSRQAPQVEVGVEITNTGTGQISVAPAFSNLVALAPMSQNVDAREAVRYACSVACPQGVERRELAHPTIHFEQLASGLVEGMLGLSCAETGAGIRLESEMPDLESFYVHVWNPADCCLKFSRRQLGAGESVSLRYRVTAQTA